MQNITVYQYTYNILMRKIKSKKYNLTDDEIEIINRTIGHIENYNTIIRLVDTALKGFIVKATDELQQEIKEEFKEAEKPLKYVIGIGEEYLKNAKEFNLILAHEIAHAKLRLFYKENDTQEEKDKKEYIINRYLADTLIQENDSSLKFYMEDQEAFKKILKKLSDEYLIPEEKLLIFIKMRLGITK